MAGRGKEADRVLRLGEQWEAGRGDGGDTDPAVCIVAWSWAGGSVELRRHCRLPGWIEVLS